MTEFDTKFFCQKWKESYDSHKDEIVTSLSVHLPLSDKPSAPFDNISKE